MKEINEAYETITKQRSGGGGGGYQQSSGYSQGGSYSSSGSSDFVQVRQMIQRGDLAGAERLLQEAPQRNGEWYFLVGSIAYRKGWLDDAMRNYSMAVQMEPGNMEYRQALAMMQQRSGGYRPYGYTTNTVDGMDCCTTMLCLNCLCGGCN